MKAVWRQAEEKMANAGTTGQTLGIIAQALSALNDSHTFFIPPRRAYQTSFGWRMTIFGNRCFITAVKPGSDADTQGVKPGDEVLELEGYAVNRNTLWKMRMSFYTIQPRAALNAVLRSPSGALRKVTVKAEVKQTKRVVDLTDPEGSDYFDMIREEQMETQLDPHKTVSLGKDILVYRMPDFGLEQQEVDNLMNRTKGFSSLVLDLRGNGGGAVSALEYMAGHLLGKDALLASRKGRKEMDPIRSKAHGEPTFRGKVIVLVDSESGSAAEILARALQLEGRATVVGDITSGSVRQSRQHSGKLGVDRIVLFSVSITNADLLMKDGQSLEHVGVKPDEAMTPAPEDLAAERDPVLARAIELAGGKLSAQDAAQLFPVKWRGN